MREEAIHILKIFISNEQSGLIYQAILRNLTKAENSESSKLIRNRMPQIH